MLRSKKFLKGAAAAAIIVSAVVLSPGTAGATPTGLTHSVAVVSGTGSSITYACVVTDPDPTTVVMSLDECRLENSARVTIHNVPTPLVVPGNTVAGASMSLTGIIPPATYYVCYKATALHEFAPPQTVADCEPWNM